MLIIIGLLLPKCRVQTSAPSRSWLDPKLWKLGASEGICFVSVSLHVHWGCAQCGRKVPHPVQAQIFLPSP